MNRAWSGVAKIKDKMLEDLNENREQALCRIKNMESDLINIKETARQTDKLKNEFIELGYFPDDGKITFYE